MESGHTIAGRYRLLRPLGAGAMGEVWAATNVLTDRVVALKLIPRGAHASEELRSRMLREARACGRIQHRNVVEIYDVGQAESGDPFLVMQLLRGETLDHRLQREGRIPEREAIAIALQIARALAAAHAAGVVHRDLKPANVFLHREPDEQVATVKVLDFGVSKVLVGDASLATVTGSVIGSPAYMSPEQARGASGLDARSDVWSFGALLFELIAGRIAFAGDTAYAAVGEVLHGKIPRLIDEIAGVSPAIDAIVAACLQRDPAQRPTAGGLVADLEALAGTGRVSATEPAAPAVVVRAATGPSATSTTPLLQAIGAPVLVPPRRSIGPVIVLSVLALIAIPVIGAMVLRSNEPSPASTSERNAKPTPRQSSAPSASTTGPAAPTAIVEDLAPEEPPMASVSAAVKPVPKKPKPPPKSTSPTKPIGPTIPDSPG